MPKPEPPLDVRVTDDQPPLDVNIVGGDLEELPTEGQYVARRRAAEMGRVTSGQRRINLIWEGTQGIIAMGLVGTACYSLLSEIALPAEYWLLLGIVVNSYFQRTNHTKIGGVGPTDAGR